MRNVLNIIVSKFVKDSCLVRASGLAYSSLLAVVPFITVLFAFGSFDTLGRTIEKVIIDSLIPVQQEAILEIINDFTRNSLATGTLGTIFFLGTTLFLINNIARNFDAIWGVKNKIGLFTRFTTYTALLVFISLLLGASSSITGSIENYISSFAYGTKDYKETISILFPFLSTFTTFFIMLLIIPSTKVKIRSAAIGAVISAFLFEIIKIVFKFWALNSVQTSVIYGSLSIIPIFLVGLYLFWLFVLIGVEITYYMQNKNGCFSGSPEELTVQDKLTLIFETFKLIAEQFRSDDNVGLTSRQIADKLGISYNLLDYFLSELLSNGLIVSVNSKKGGYIPSRSLDKIYLYDLVKVVYGEGEDIKNISDLSNKNSYGFTKGGYDSLDKRCVVELLKD
ncbi:MAG: YihY family inner membrane protein [Spirochaetaceae bacterium]